MPDEGSGHVVPHDHDDGGLDLDDEGGSSEERQPRWHLELRLLQHRSRPLHVHLQRVAGDQVGKSRTFSKTHNALIKDESSFQFILSIQN